MSASSIPIGLRNDVLAGHGRHPDLPHRRQGTAEIVVGVPIPSVQAVYFEVFDLSDLDHTLRVLGLTLFGAGVVTTLLGIALGPLRQRALAAPAGRRVAGRRAPSPEASSTPGSTPTRPTPTSRA